MSAPRYSTLIRPDCTEVGQLANEISEFAHQATNRWAGHPLKTTLSYFWNHYTFVHFLGVMPVEETLRSYKGNCLSLSCLVVATLKRLAFYDNDVAVFVGCRILQPGRLHAYVLAPGERAGHVYVVDPQFMKALSVSLEGFWVRYRVYLMFDEKSETSEDQQKRAWVSRIGDKDQLCRRARGAWQTICTSVEDSKRNDSEPTQHLITKDEANPGGV